jgi:uncharacterized membrane protein
MDDIGAYLSRLRKRLKADSDSEREDITAEIRSHIEDGLQDPQMGSSETQRLEKIMSELGHPTKMANEMNKVHRDRRYMRPVMAGGAVLLIASAFLPFAAIFAIIAFPAPTLVGGIVFPFHFWWFGYPLITIGVGMLLLSIFRLSHRTALIHTTVGSLLSVIATTAVSLSFIKAWPLLPYAFLPMLIGGLILAIGGVQTIRRKRYLPR